MQAVNAHIEGLRTSGEAIGSHQQSLAVEGLDGATLVREVSERRPGLFEVSVQVRWDERTTLPDHVRVTTLLARGGKR